MQMEKKKQRVTKKMERKRGEHTLGEVEVDFNLNLEVGEDLAATGV